MILQNPLGGARKFNELFAEFLNFGKEGFAATNLDFSKGLILVQDDPSFLDIFR